MSRHIIHKQKITLNIESIDKAFSYQHIVSDLFANGLKTAIDNILSNIDIPDHIIRIDTLNLDLGKINAENFSFEFKEKLLFQLRNSLSIFYNAQENNNAIASGKNPVLKPGLYTRPETGIKVLKQSESLREGFIYFIKKGILPWFVEAKDMAGFEAAIFKDWNEADWLFVTNWFHNNVTSYKQSIKRLVLQFSANFLKQIISSAVKETIGDNEWKLLLNDLEYIYDKLDLSIELHINISSNFKKYLIQTFELLFDQNKSFTLNTLIADSLLSAIKENKNVIAIKRRDIMLSNIQTELVATIVKNIYFFMDRKISFQDISIEDLLPKDLSGNTPFNQYTSKNNHLKSFKDENDEKDDKDAKRNLLINENMQLAEQQTPVISKADLFKEKDVLFVDNCGVILLHLFLQPYFDELLLIKNKNFVSEEAQKRAVLLLHYLSTGFAEAAEFNLILEKILCGYILEESLFNSIDLSETEIGESEKLLQSVIKYWPPLKNTSIEGLQKTFLQRAGKLVAKETGWQLTVEQKTVDILLDKLPWGYSTIRLPWMRNIISVDWC